VNRAALAVVLMLLAGMSGNVPAQSRGELLYTTHCIGCHDTQIHWRDQRRATDLASLKNQVRLWQGRNMLQWGEDDINEVTRYLSERIYRFGDSSVRASLGASSPVETRSPVDNAPARGR
jgi:hypothetical protein